MRNPEFNPADAAGILSDLLDRVATRPAAVPGQEARPSAPRQMSIVDFTEELLKQVAANKRS
ncbi:MAG TPA: hypothetical protein VIM12_18295 [Noviherbaspirillum sp.]|jgi:hypothetical protein|uniref:hypothetical protein n=1 Tax=Noviherbaspirillum sp. TaxID=1926288 RepID=UPI002F94234B